MSHPLAPRPSSAPTPHRHPEAGKRDLTPDEVSAWAKTVPPIEKGVLHRGQPVDVLNLRQRIIVGAPAYGDVTSHFMHSYIACKEKLGAWYRMPDGSIQRLPVIAGMVQPIGDSHVDRARNNTVNQWDRTDATDWLYWWDVDIEVQPEMLFRTFALALDRALPFLCGVYAMKTIMPAFVANVRPGTQTDPATGLREIRDGGTGSMLWNRSVLTTLRAHPEVKPYVCAPNSPHAGQIHWAYFSSGVYGEGIPLEHIGAEERARFLATPNGGRTFTAISDWLSEDWKVCRLFQDQGAKVYADENFKSRHSGNLIYPPHIPEIKDAYHHLLARHHPIFAEWIEELRRLAAAYQPPAPPPPAAPAQVIEFPKAA